MENGRVEVVDLVHGFHGDPVNQLPESVEGTFEIATSFSEEEQPGVKVVLKEQTLTGKSEASACANGEQHGESPTAFANGTAAGASLQAEEPATDDRTGEAETEFDAEGYRVEERRETETLSHTEEITEKPERTELRTREIKEVMMEEVKTRETTRPVSIEELKAILEAELDKTDEVEIGRDIVIEEFSRVESEREEASGGRVTMATFSLKEEHTTQEIKEQLQFPGSERNGFEEEPERRVDEATETVEEVQLVKVLNPEAQIEAFQEEVAPTSEEAPQKSEDVPQKSEDVPQKSEEAPTSVDAEKEKIAEENKGEKEKGAKSRGIINYIKVKARSLSRDRSRNRAAALASATAAADESGQPSTEEPQSKEEGKSAAKKTKQKKWIFFGKKSAGEQDDSSSEASASEDDNAADKSDKKKFKLNLFTKRPDEQKEEGAQVNREAAAKTPPEKVAKEEEKPAKEEDKQITMKLVLVKKDKQKKEAEHKSAEEQTKPKTVESETEGENASPTQEEEKALPQQGTQEKEQTEGGSAKAKEHKWFYFGKKTDKESHSPEPEKSKETSEEKDHKWNLFGKKARKDETPAGKTDLAKPETEVHVITQAVSLQETVPQEQGQEERRESEEVKGEETEQTTGKEAADHKPTNEEDSVQQNPKAYSVEGKVSEKDGTEVSKPSSPDAVQHPEAPAAEGKKSSENQAASTESKEEGQKKASKEHKKFSFGLKFGKKNKKSQEKTEEKSSKETDVHELTKTADEETEATGKVEQIAAEAQISIDDAVNDDKAAVTATVQASFEPVEEGSSSALAEEKQPVDAFGEANKEDSVNVDREPELPTDQLDDAQIGEVEVAQAVQEKQVSESVRESEILEVGQNNEVPVDVQEDKITSDKGHPNDVLETVQQTEITESKEKVVSMSEGDEWITEQALESLEESELREREPKQVDTEETKTDQAVQEKEAKEMVQPSEDVLPMQEVSAEHTALELIKDNAPEQLVPEVSAEAQAVVNSVEETLADAAVKKEQKQSKKFSFNLKMGHKKDASKLEDETQKHKVWSPFSKKPAKKEKEGLATAADEDGKDDQVAADCKTPDSNVYKSDAEHTQEAEKVEVPEPKQSESREGTLKRNKGIHKLFSFGKKSKNVDEKAVTVESKAAAAETNGETEAAVSDKTVEGGASAEKGTSETVEEEKHRSKKFSFGLKFGKKHDRDSAAGEGLKQIQTPTEERAVTEDTKEPAPSVPAATEPQIHDERVTLQTTQTGISEEAASSEPTIMIETKEQIVSHTEVMETTAPGVSQVVVTDGSQEGLPVCLEVSSGEVRESAVSQIEVASPKVDVKVEKNDEDQPGKQEESVETAGKIEASEQLSNDNIEVTLETCQKVEATIAQNITDLSLAPPTLELGGNEKVGSKEDSAHASETEEEQIPKMEATLLEESGVDLETDKPTLEFEDANKLVDEIMTSELSAEVKSSEEWLDGEISDLKLGLAEVPVVVVTESSSETAAAPIEADAPVTALPEIDAGELKKELQSTDDKPGDVTERLEATDAKSEVQSESAKEQKQKKPLFGIKFGKKPKQIASKEQIDEHEQNVVTDVGKGTVERTNSELSAEADKPDVKQQEAAARIQNVEELIIEVEVREEKEESKNEDAEEKHHQAGIKWPHFGKKADKKKEEKENGEQTATKSDEAEITVLEADTSSKQPKGSAKKPSHGLGKGFLKIFTPKKQLKFDKSKTNGEVELQQQEPVVVYSIEGEGQVVAETHWRPKQESELVKCDVETSEQLPKTNGLQSDEIPQATNDQISTEHVDKEATPATRNGSAHEPEVPVVQVSHSACAESPQPSSESPGHFVVVAIDFGTTFSGYAFSFINDPDSIHMMRKWEGGDPGVVNQKTPTTILLTPDGNFHSFGFTARDFYHDLDASEVERWMYFEKFKMALHHNTELNLLTTITASNGKEFPAMRLFSYALRFFKDHALKELTSQSSFTIDNDDVRWVITVPAIWKAPAKQFMRQAAYQAGIASPSFPDHLLIALEPEAASIYVRKLRMSQLVPIRPPPTLALTPNKETSSPVPPHDEFDNSLTALDSEHVSDHLKAGTRYMVVDCGGGTVDITVHELETSHGSLKELYKATGGPYGSTGVDQDFGKLLFEIFGSEFIETFKQKRPAGWVDLMIAFESRKRAANPHKDNPLNVSLPFSFIDFYKKQYGSQVDSAIKRFGGDRGVSWSLQGMLRLTPEAMHNLFQPTLDRITSAISDVLSNPTVKGIEYMFLVGGFSESPMLQHELRKTFGDKIRIIIPQDVSLTILKGAVCFGLDPTVVTVRQSRMTYGVGVVNRFDPSRHPDSKRIQKGGIDWCAGIFDTFVFSGQPVTLGDKVIRRYAPANRDQKASIIHVYCSESSDVQYVTDPGVQRCATMRLELVDAEAETGVESGAARREIEATMTFGDTEIRVAARDVTTGRNVASTIDFLNK